MKGKGAFAGPLIQALTKTGYQVTGNNSSHFSAAPNFGPPSSSPPNSDRTSRSGSLKTAGTGYERSRYRRLARRRQSITRCRTMFAVPSEHACLPVAPANLIMDRPRSNAADFPPGPAGKAMAARGASV